jgi:hypothetical protein
MGHARLRSNKDPGKERDNGDQYNTRHKIRRDLIGQALDRGAGPSRLVHHADDLGEHRVGPDVLGPNDQAAGAVDRATDNPVTRSSSHRDRFAADHRFIDRAFSFDDYSVNRDFLARPDPEPIAGLDLVERDILLVTVGSEPPR